MKPIKKKDRGAQRLGAKGGKARAAKQTPEQRSESARHAVLERWRLAKMDKSK